MKNEEVLDYIPNFGHLSNDKKKVVLFLCKNIYLSSEHIVIIYILWRLDLYLYWYRVKY